MDRRRHEKPENVTWAKKEEWEQKSSDSFELPLQGPRKSEGRGGGGKDNDKANDNANEHDEGDGATDPFGTFRYHRGWV